MKTTLESIENLIPRYNYSKEKKRLVFTHNVKRKVTVEIEAEWFDINYGEKVQWLLIRESSFGTLEHSKYRNIKFENIDPIVKIIEYKGEKNEKKKTI